MTADPARMMASLDALGAVEATLLLLGHGNPWRDL